MASVFCRHESIEHVWDALGRRVTGRQPSPQSLHVLESALLEEWDRIPQLVINSLIDSMPQRGSTLLAVRGNHTPYCSASQSCKTRDPISSHYFHCAPPPIQ
ncbi:transposable element Tcb2 transposase [Trichonephila clavipes]|nr:transposable element Tcb2 transposase [Trichonephila clavipes]